MTHKNPAQILTRTVARFAQQQLLDDAKWHRTMQDPHGLADELERLATLDAPEMFQGLARLASAFVVTPAPAEDTEGGQQ